MKYSVAIVTVLSLVCCTLADSKPDSNPDHAVNHNHFHFTGQARNGAYNPYGGYPQYGGCPGAYPGAGGYGGYPGGYGGYGGYGAPGGYGGYPSPYGANPYGEILLILFIILIDDNTTTNLPSGVINQNDKSLLK